MDSFLLSAAALIVLAIAAFSYQDWNEYRRASAKAEAHQKLLDSLDDLLSTMLDAETGQRGFLLTGNDRYLEPYRRAVQSVQGQLASVAEGLVLIEGGAGDGTRLKSLVDLKLAELHETIDLRKTQSLDEALKVVSSDRGRRIMDQLRTAFARIHSDVHKEWLAETRKWAPAGREWWPELDRYRSSVS